LERVQMTRPGGMMLIPNFLTGVRDSGYMEAFMDWRLIYRNHADMLVLAAGLPRSAVAFVGFSTTPMTRSPFCSYPRQAKPARHFPA
jgi:hypothetical protein